MLLALLLACRATEPGCKPSEELCNGADDDCDGAIDEDAAGALTWYADADGDGFGDPERGLVSCEPAGVVAATDCDDAAATVSPVGTELCNGVDDDCDGEVDDDPADASTWYDDADGDGFGDPSSARSSCDGPLSDGTDCDDADATVSPAGFEVCNGVDDDCDGTIDEDAADAPTWYADADGDGFGDPAAGTTSCEPVGTADTTDCDDTDASISPAGIELCNELDDDCDGTVDEDAADAPTWYADSDGDRFGDPGSGTASCDPVGLADGTDCDDGDPTVFPGATEWCDGVDEDCDRAADEDAVDAPTWYADADGDGFGDPSLPEVACVSGGVADATDCDDTDAGVSPAASEHCDDRDEDCDGAVDEDAIDPATWYTDADGDGYGDPDTAEVACTATGIADGSDCDDTDAAVSPAGTELCNERDDDCDGAVDEEPVDGWTGYADADADGYGDPDVFSTSCTPGGITDDTDCDDSDASIHPGAEEDPWDGVDSDCAGADSVADLDSFWVEGEDRYGSFGNRVDVAPDLDGDGVGELLVGENDSNAGFTYVFSGTLVGQVTTDDATWEIRGDNGAPAEWAPGDMLGRFLVTSDLDADGALDLVVSVCGHDWSHGATATFYGAGALAAGTRELWGSDADAFLTGPAPWADAGCGLDRIGDRDGDGGEDLVVGADCAGTDCTGEVYLVPGVASGEQLMADVADNRIEGPTSPAWAYFGASLATVGDTDGDGLDDVLVGSPGSTTTDGAVYLFTDLSVTTYADATATLTAEAAGDAPGRDLAVVGDTNADGYADVYADASGRTWNTLYGFEGPVSGTLSLGSADVVIEGTSSLYLTRTFNSAGDMDGDGTEDLLVSATPSTEEGAVLLALSPLAGVLTSEDLDLRIDGQAAGDYLGGGMASGDLEGDGVRDLLLGASGHEISGRPYGAVWLVPLEW